MSESFRMFKEQIEKLKNGELTNHLSFKSLFTSEVDFYIFKRAIETTFNIAYDLRDKSNPYAMLYGKFGPVIIGVNEDGKLFSNIASASSVFLVSKGEFDHYKVLGYDYDSNRIYSSGSYRVQGDLVFQALAYDEDSIRLIYDGHILDEVCNAIRHKVRRHYMIETLKYLNKLGLGCEIGDDYIYLRRRGYFEKVKRYLERELNKIGKSISKRFGGQACVESLRCGFMDFRFHYLEDTERISKLYGSLINESVEELLSCKREKRIVMGNHIITVSSYPIMARLELPDLLLDGYLTISPMFTDIFTSFITDEDIIVEHPEHGTTIVKVDPKYYYYITPRFTLTWGMAIRNTYIFKKLEREIESE